MNVTIGLGTIVGYVLAAVSGITPLIGELADNLAPLGVPAQTWVIVSAVLAGITTLGRMYQAAQAAGQIVTEPVPEDGGADEPGV